MLCVVGLITPLLAAMKSVLGDDDNEIAELEKIEEIRETKKSSAKKIIVSTARQIWRNKNAGFKLFPRTSPAARSDFQGR